MAGGCALHAVEKLDLWQRVYFNTAKPPKADLHLFDRGTPYFSIRHAQADLRQAAESYWIPAFAGMTF